MHREKSRGAASPKILSVAVVAGVWTAVILLLTLRPGRGSSPVFSQFFCFICGAWGVEMSILNFLLFLPLGLALSLHHWNPRKVAASIFLLTVGIEFLQAFIPGRYPSLGDVFFNSLGGIVGIGIVMGVAGMRKQTVR